MFFFLSKHISNVFIIEILLLMYYHYEERERLTKRISRRLKKRFFLGVFTVFTSERINSTYGRTNSSCHLKDSIDFINFIEKNEQNYLQTHGNPMGTEMEIAFGNIFMAKIEMQILDKGTNKPHVWRLKLSLAHQQIRRQPVH